MKFFKLSIFLLSMRFLLSTCLLTAAASYFEESNSGNTVTVAVQDGHVALPTFFARHATLLGHAKLLQETYMNDCEIPLTKYKRHDLELMAGIFDLRTRATSCEQLSSMLSNDIRFKETSEHQAVTLYEIGDYLECDTEIMQALASTFSSHFAQHYLAYLQHKTDDQLEVSVNNRTILESCIAPHFDKAINNALLRFLPLKTEPLLSRYSAGSVFVGKYFLEIKYNPNEHYDSALREVKIFDAFSSEVKTKHTITVQGPIEARASDAKGLTVALGLQSGTIIIYHMSSGERIHTLKAAFPGYINSLDYSPDGKYLLAVSGAKNAYIWDTETGACLSCLTNPDSYTTEYAYFLHAKYNPNGKTFAVVGGKTVYIWDIEKKEWLCTLRGFEGNIIDKIHYSPDGRLLLAGSTNGEIGLWDAQSGEMISIFMGHQNSIHRIFFSPSGETFVSTGYDGKLRIWSTAEKKCLYTLPSWGNLIYAATYSPDGSELFTINDRLRIWNILTGECIFEESNTSIKAWHIECNPEGTSLSMVKSCSAYIFNMIETFSNYLGDLKLIVNKDEKLFLVLAMLDWIQRRPHKVLVGSRYYKLYNSLKARFPYLDNINLFRLVDSEIAPGLR